MTNTPTTWTNLLDAWERWMIAGARPASTRTLRRSQLVRLARSYPDPATVTTDDLTDWLGSHGWSKETLRSHRAALRTFWQWAHLTGRLPDDPTLRLPRVRPSSHTARPAPEVVWRDAMATAEPRVALAIALGARAGLRRTEIAQSRREDAIEDLSGWSMTVRGKGDRVRVVPLVDDLARLIRAADPGWLFPSPYGGHLTPAHLAKLITRAMRGKATTHQLRHRFATTVHDHAQDLVVVQELLGHANINTTRVYVEVGRRRMREAVAQAA